MPRIFDNLTPESRLLTHLNNTMAGATRADICVGYFNLRGWRGLADAVDGLESPDAPQCRVLVGMQRGPEDEVRAAYRLTPEPDIDQATVVRRTRQMADAFRQQLVVGRQTNEDEAALRRLRNQIGAGRVRIKLFLRHPLHAKLYLVHRLDEVTPRAGFLGSSNLTFAGLHNQGELNVDVVDQDSTAKLQHWFDDRWRDKWCVDISEQLATIIDESWARPDLIPPYLVYLKMAYHLSRDARAGLSEFSIPADFGAELFDFQAAAVKIAAHHLNRHGGVLIGDVVGLGKTLMATALARVFQEDQGAETLIICPKNLESMWNAYRERHRLLAKVLPISRALNDLPDMRRYRLVLIDESHNLRNREGKVYRAIQDYVARNESLCILLSATPYNKTFLDLGSQLRLFVNPEADLGIRPERLIADVSETEFVRRHQAGPRTLAAFEHSEFPEDWRLLMRRYMVRRTRSFIQENYAKREDGRTFLETTEGVRFYFPVRRPKSLKFAFDPEGDDPYPRLFSPEVVNAIDGLLLPRYGLGNYIRSTPPKKPSKAEKAALENLSRAGIRLKGFCRTNLFKRLESGGPAFLQSIERHILRNEAFLYAIEEGLPLPIGAQDEALFDTLRFDRDADAAQRSLDDLLDEGDAAAADDAADHLDAGDAASFARARSRDRWREAAQKIYEGYEFGGSRERIRWIPSEFFDPGLARDLAADVGALHGVLDLCGTWNPDQDAKLDRLVRLIRQDHPNRKVLVFTQFADTVEYLDAQLRRRGITNAAGVTAAAKDPTALAWRFSPVSNGRQDLAAREGELRVLVATDVLSEGQNLQDCNVIVNYDLPWAIIRLIQRAGRVDRIGQHAEEILCYSFLPADGLERIIDLRGRLRRRLRENGEVVGADEAFFEDDPNDHAVLDLYSEKAGILDDEADGLGVDPTSEAFQVWKNATDADPSLRRKVEALPDVVYSSRAHAAHQGRPPGAIVYVRAPDGNDSLAWVNQSGTVVSESAIDVLRAAACHPETPALPRAENHHPLVTATVRHLLDEHARAGGQLGRPSGARYRTYERLKRYHDGLKGKTVSMFGVDPGNELDFSARIDPTALGRVVEDIHNRPLRQAAADSLNRLLKSGASDEEIARRAIELRDDGRLSIDEGQPEDAEPRIVCSLGLQAGGGG